MLEMVILGEDGHQFVVHIKSIVEAPVIGASIKCGLCKQQTKVKMKGIPHRIEHEQHPIDNNQTKLKE